MKKYLKLCFLLLSFASLTHGECDEVFDECDEEEPVQNEESACDDPVFCEGDLGTEVRPDDECADDPIFCETETIPDDDCLSINEIDDQVFSTEVRQAVNVCGDVRGTSCSDYEDHGFVCAPVWTCRNNTIITDGKGLIDVRASSLEEEENQCGRLSGTLDVTDKKCDKYDHVCCKKPNFRIKKCDDIIRPGERITNQSDEENEIDTSDQWDQCGRNASGSIKLTGTDASYDGFDYEAQPGEFPHMCIMFKLSDGYRQYLGGAALIAPNKVVTVAHKFYKTNGGLKDIRDKVDEIHIRCGEHNVKEDNTYLPSQESVVREIILHPNYDPRRIHYNLAILVTEYNFVYQSHIGPVCLPSPNENFDNRKDCWSSGWGSDSSDVTQGLFSDTLKKIDMPIVPPNKCRNIFRRNNLPSSRVHPSWLCVGGVENKDTCKGDGGSPHVCFNKKNKYVLVGSVSHGVGCGTEIPASYSNIAGSMCWIDYVMSTVPMAEFDVDLVEAEEDLGLRQGGAYKSVNKLTEEQCGDWKASNPDLFDFVDIKYSVIDNRNGLFDNRST